MNKKAKQSLGIVQMMILILGTLAIAWLIGSEVGSVEGADAAVAVGGGVVASSGINTNANILPQPTITSTPIYPRTQSFWEFNTGLEGYTPGYSLPPSSPDIYVEQGALDTIVEGYNSASDAFLSMFGLGEGGEGLGALAGNAWTASLKGIGAIGWGAVIAAGVYATVRLLGAMVGADSDRANRYAISLAAGSAAGWGTYQILGSGSQGLFGIGALGTGALVGVGVAYYAVQYEKTRVWVLNFDCAIWEPPEGGRYCDLCNDRSGDFPCSEYQCRSLGANCELENQGTDEETCVWKNRNDVIPPVIQPWIEPLTTGYEYNPDNTISPPDRGVKIMPTADNSESEGECVTAYNRLSFGITTDELSRCRIDTNRSVLFDEMKYFGGSNTLKYNHTQVMALPGADENGSIILLNGNEMELYVKCKDANGNENTGHFVFKFCVEEGRDSTPPEIVTTDILNNSPIAFGTQSVDMGIYINEPAECRWSHRDQEYDSMPSENQMNCPNRRPTEFNAQILYKCTTTLSGLHDREQNDFYFRCKDQPDAREEADRVTNRESYYFVLFGTEPLIITEIRPNETIRDSTEPAQITLEADTFGGFNDGEAWCYYGTSERASMDEDNLFENTYSYTHSHRLWLEEGDYTYYVTCTDMGGNIVTNSTDFTVFIDRQAPEIARAFNEDNRLKIVTDEEGECVYGTNTNTECTYDFDDGTPMIDTGVNNTEHYTTWDSSLTYYIKCKDEYDNQPYPNQCSIIVKPVDTD